MGTPPGISPSSASSLTAGRQNEALESGVGKTCRHKWAQTRQVEGVAINAADLLPADLSYYSYVGSLTTPPCSEDVRWYVLADPVEVSPAQIGRFAALYPG